MDKIKASLQESWNEVIHQVSWSTWPELIGHTRVVLIGLFIMAALVFLIDVISKTGMDLVYGVN